MGCHSIVYPIMAFVYFLSVGLVGSLTSDFIDAFSMAHLISILQWEIPFACQGLGPWLSGVILFKREVRLGSRSDSKRRDCRRLPPSSISCPS
jgi:hypothetical protein